MIRMEVVPEVVTRVGFGLFEADLRTGELWKAGRRVKLQSQPFKVLTLLLERAGDVVTREELQARLWGADAVGDFDHSLGTAVNKIREALGDTADNPRFVETLARRGYRWIAPVSVLGTATVRPEAGIPGPILYSGAACGDKRLLRPAMVCRRIKKRLPRAFLPKQRHRWHRHLWQQSSRSRRRLGLRMPSRRGYPRRCCWPILLARAAGPGYWFRLHAWPDCCWCLQAGSTAATRAPARCCCAWTR